MYDRLDRTFRADMGPYPDITCAFFNGDFSMTLEEAQRAKHEYILNGINFKPSMRVLDIGSGWGGFLNTVRERGGVGVGLNVSPKQVAYCQKEGLDARLLDWRDVQPGQLGEFGAVVSIGSLEHFASKEDYLTEKQDEVYQRFFQFCYDNLPDGGRLFVQTMVFGKHMPPAETISLHAQKGSNEYLLALMEKAYLGAWLPYGKDQVDTNAERQGFRLISENNGRLDYIHTMDEWAAHSKKFGIKKIVPWVTSAVSYATDSYFRDEVKAIMEGANLEMFKREVWDHWRLVFEKRPA